jgi:PST family polysaccharide transporter
VTDTPTLASEVRTGLRWSVSSQLAVRLVSLASGVVLVKILGESSFGIYAFGLAVSALVMSINDFGQVMAVASWPGDDHEEAARTATTVVWTISATLYLALFLVAPWLGEALTDRPADATIVVRVMGLLILIDAACTTPRALLIRSLANDKLALADLAGVPVNAVVAVGLALAGAGPVAPAWATIAAAVVTGSVVLYHAPVRPRPTLNRAHLRGLLSFGGPMAGTSFTENLLLNVDTLVVSSTLGSAPAGLYAVAFNVSSWPTSVLTQAIRRVSIVGFSRLNHDRAQLYAAFAKAAGIMVVFAGLVGALLSGLAEPLIGFLYDDDRLPAAPVLQWLAVLGVVRVSLGLVFDLLIAIGRGKDTFRLQLAWLAVIIPAVWLGARVDDIRGVGIAHAAVAAGLAVPAFLLAVAHNGFAIGAVVRAAVRPIVVGAGLAVVTSLVAGAFPSRLVALLVLGPTVAIAYFLAALPPSQWRSWARLEPLRAG